MTRQETTGDSYAAVNPKVFGKVNFDRFGDLKLAYLGVPTLAPETASLRTGQAVVHRCAAARRRLQAELRVANIQAKAGNLDDGLGEQGVVRERERHGDVSREYDNTQAFADLVNVDVRNVDPEDPDAPPPTIGTACAHVAVAGCGDGVKDADEECDGSSDDACPGHCTPQCKCEISTDQMRLVFVGKGIAPAKSRARRRRRHRVDGSGRRSTTSPLPTTRRPFRCRSRWAPTVTGDSKRNNTIGPSRAARVRSS